MTESLKECLSTDKLRDYALGRMPEEQWERVASHLETCATCEDTISSLDGTADSMLDHLRMAPSQSIEGTPEYLAAMKKLQNQSAQEKATSSRIGNLESSDQVGAHNPDVVRDYKLIAILGAGGMGTVYKAIHTKLDRVVALKLLPTRRIGNADAIVRFEREMKAIGKLDHPAIVRATDAGEDDGQHFLAMEFVDGFDVSELVDRHGPLSIPDACEIIRQAAIGLQHVHEQQLVHRDIKPSNLMVTENGHVKILDLGLALLADQHEGLGELTTVGQMMGTVDYMAPEQCDDSHDVDIRADIYSLGATLFKMVVGTAPYATSERRSPLSRIRALATEDVPRLTECLPNADTAFCSMVDRMLSRQPGDRFETPGEVADTLQRFTEGHDLKQAITVAADAPAPVRTLPPAPQRQLPAPSAASPAVGSSSRPPTKTMGIARLLIPAVILAATAVFVFRLQTDKGELIVECNVPNVEVQLLRDGEVHKELSIRQGTTSVSVFSGNYEIRIPGEADSIEVSTDRFKISRGSRLIARIRHSKSLVDSPIPALSSSQTKVEPRYSGKTFAEWRQQLADRDPTQFRPALSAIGILGVDSNATEAGRLIFEAVQPLFRHSSKTAPFTFPQPSGTAEDVTRYMAVQAYRPLLDDPKGVELLREFLTEGATAARRYALCVLNCREERPSSSAPGYAAAQRANAQLVPALIDASHDEDVSVRTSAIGQTQGFEAEHPEVIDRYVEMISSEDFAEFYDISGILFDLAPEHRPLIGQRHLRFYLDNIEAFRSRRAAGEGHAIIGDYSVGAMHLLFAAIECRSESPKITEALFETLNDTRTSVNERALAIYLLVRHVDQSDLLVPALITLLRSASPQLDEKCNFKGHRFNHEFGPATVTYTTFRSAIFEALGNLGPKAQDAIPVLNEFLNPNPKARNVNIKLTIAEHEAQAKALQALSKIGLTADSIPAIERFVNWPEFRSAKPDLAPLASRILRNIPEKELKRLRTENEETNQLQR